MSIVKVANTLAKVNRIDVSATVVVFIIFSKLLNLMLNIHLDIFHNLETLKLLCRFFRVFFEHILGREELKNLGIINLFVPYVLFLNPWKTSENLTVL